MKIRICSILMLALLAVSAFAQQQPFNEDQKREAQEELKKLGQVFGVNTTPATDSKKQVSPTTSTEQPKTLAGVADKALDMVGNAVASISATVQKVAPEIWRIMIRQQYANAVGGVLDPLGILLVLLIYRVFTNKHWQPKEDDENDVNWKIALVQVIPIALMVISGLGLVWGLTRAFQIWINPEYYAVRDLLQTLLNSSGQ